MTTLTATKERIMYGGTYTGRFYDEEHKYIITDNTTMQEFCPVGASTISKFADQIGYGLAASAAYLTKLGKDYKSEWDKASALGTAVHNWIERYVNGEHQVMPEDKDQANCINAFLAWEQKTKPKFETQELLVYSKEYDIAGLIDQPCVTFEAEDYKIKHVLDYKTSKMSSLSMAIQTEWYLRMLTEEFGNEGYGDNIILQLLKDYNYKTPVGNGMKQYLFDRNKAAGYLEYRVSDHDYVFNGCLACLTLYKLNNRK